MGEGCVDGSTINTSAYSCVNVTILFIEML